MVKAPIPAFPQRGKEEEWKNEGRCRKTEARSLKLEEGHRSEEMRDEI